MSDIGDVDIDELLAQTSELAAKASEEVGAEEEGATSPSDEIGDETGGQAGDEVKGQQAAQASHEAESESEGSIFEDISVDDADQGARDDQGQSDSDSTASAAPAEHAVDEADPVGEPSSDDSPEGVDDRLAELEAMLGNVAGDQPADSDDASEAGSTEGDSGDAAAAKDPSSAKSAPLSGDSGGSAAVSDEAIADFDDYDDFDISVDLSDDEETAEAELADKSEQVSEAVAVPKGPIHVRILEGVVSGIGGIFIVLDIPFRALPLGVKQALGYVAVATLAVAVGGMVYGALSH